MIIVTVSYNDNKILDLANNINKRHSRFFSFRVKVLAFLCKLFNKDEYDKIIDNCNTIEIVRGFSKLTPRQMERHNIIVDHSSHETTFRDNEIKKKILDSNQSKNLIINIPMISDLKKSDFISQADLILVDRDIQMGDIHQRQLQHQFKEKEVKLF